MRITIPKSTWKQIKDEDLQDAISYVKICSILGTCSMSTFAGNDHLYKILSHKRFTDAQIKMIFAHVTTYLWTLRNKKEETHCIEEAFNGRVLVNTCYERLARILGQQYSYQGNSRVKVCFIALDSKPFFAKKGMVNSCAENCQIAEQNLLNYCNNLLQKKNAKK